MPNTCCRVAPEHRPDTPGQLVGQPGAADLQDLQRAQGAGAALGGMSQPALGHRGTTAVIVTPSRSMAAKALAGSGDAIMTTRPPDSRVPRMPGQASGKLCEAGSETR